MIIYPTGKKYIGKDSIGSYRYFGSPNMDLVNVDFARLPEATRKDYPVRKLILWASQSCAEAELSALDVDSGLPVKRPGGGLQLLTGVPSLIRDFAPRYLCLLTPKHKDSNGADFAKT
ncbi:hypothetical protein [Marinobacter gelidimuriae]|jgi:hypothetical protein|uniref:hypothetical protein n=1 Tax=Marinobacter gelidimuriae TaxID=2739064 RepID=UPI001C465690|nr:hypothetical protein [Marinobacter gelidimuriae]